MGSLVNSTKNLSRTKSKTLQENDRSVSLLNIITKPQHLLVNQIQQHMRGTAHHDHTRLITGVMVPVNNEESLKWNPSH